VTVSWKCPECGLDYDTISPSDAAVAIRSFPRRYRDLVSSFDTDDDVEPLVRTQPRPDTWSALEYTGHVADVLDLMDDLVRRMLVEDNPRLTEWDADERAAEQRYNDQSTLRTLDRLKKAAGILAATLEKVDADDWKRVATFPYGEREVIDVTRNAVHEGAHHLRDVERGLDEVRKG
jgi:hypothetical protein